MCKVNFFAPRMTCAFGLNSSWHDCNTPLVEASTCCPYCCWHSFELYGFTVDLCLQVLATRPCRCLLYNSITDMTSITVTALILVDSDSLSTFLLYLGSFMHARLMNQFLQLSISGAAHITGTAKTAAAPAEHSYQQLAFARQVLYLHSCMIDVRAMCVLQI